MEDVVRHHGWEPVTYDEGQVSGKKLSKRKVALLMLDHLRKGVIQGIGAIEFSRLTRDPIGVDLAEFKQALYAADAPIVLPDKLLWPSSPSDRVFFDMLGSFSAYELDTIKERMWKPNILRRVHGLPTNAAKAPKGYKHEVREIHSNGRVTRELVKDVDQERMILDFFRIAHSAVTMTSAAREMNRLGHTVPGRGGTDTRLWGYMDVFHLIHNPLYSGRQLIHKLQNAETKVWSKVPETANGHYVRLVPHLAYTSPDVQDAILSRWKSAAEKRVGSRGRQENNPLYGILHCAFCGGPMYHTSTTRRGGQEWMYYCGNGWKDPSKCQGIKASHPLILRAIGLYIEQILTEADATWLVTQASLTDEQGTPLQQAHASVATILRQQDHLAEMLMAFTGTPSMLQRLQEKAKELERDLAAAEREIQRLTGEQKFTSVMAEILKLPAGGFADMLCAASPLEQRVTIREVLEEVAVIGAGAGSSRRYTVCSAKLVGETETRIYETDKRSSGTTCASWGLATIISH
jgi:DNA invertase Pin-like site-specific DNA recombinase